MKEYSYNAEIELNSKLLQAIISITKTPIQSEKEFLDLAIEEAVKLTNSQVGYFHFINKDENSIALKTWSTFTLSQCSAVYDSHYPLSHAGIWADCVRTRNPVIHNDYPNAPNKKGLPDGHFNLKRHMSVPIFYDGKIIAIAGVGNKTEQYGDEDTSLLFVFMKNVIELYARYKHDIEVADYQQNLKLALKNVNAGTFRWDLEENSLLFDENLKEIFNVSPGVKTLSGAAWETFISPKEREHFIAISAKQLIAGDDFFAEFRTPEINNESKIVEVNGYISRNRKGEPVKITGVVFDVTMRRQAEHEKELLLTKIQNANKDLQFFAYAVSHDLQAPLRKVKNFAQLLAGKLSDDTDNKIIKYINYITAGVSQMYMMLQGILDFSRVTTHGTSFAYLASSELIQSAMANLDIIIAESRAIITVQEDLPEIYADKVQVSRVFQNIIENGIKYTAEDVTPEISISCSSGSDYHLFAVKDNGIGIKEEDFQRIFQIFQRLHTEAEFKGNGIGLALCKRIIERHNGELFVESTEGKGSIFYFSLPVHSSLIKD